MESLAGEAVQAFQFRVGRAVELSHGSHHDLSPVCLAAGGAQRPQGRFFVEFGAGNLGIEADMRANSVLVCAVTKVLVDLFRLAKAILPAKVLLKGEGVEVGRHIAGGAWIGVVPPDAADVASLLEQGNVIESCPLELDGEPKAAKAGTNDGNTRGVFYIDLCVHGASPEVRSASLYSGSPAEV